MLLPLEFNDGSEVPRELVVETVSELRLRFGAVSVEPVPLEGQWEHAGLVYRDRLVRVFVDVADGDAHRAFFASYKETLKKRFQQIDIWMVSHPLDII